MNQVVDGSTARPNAITDVRSEQIRILFSATSTSLLSILICSFILGVVLLDVVDRLAIIAWFCATNLLSLVRLYLYRQFRRLDEDELNGVYWYRLAIVTSLASGTAWGIGGFFLFPSESVLHQLFLAFVFAGICAGAITTLSSILTAVRGFVLLALLPVMLRLTQIDHEIATAILVLSVLFVIMILVSAQRLNQTIIESLNVRLQFELAEQTISHQAHFDSLTNLPNRRLLLSTLRQEMAKAERHRRYGAVLFVDLDRFKSINDALGHAIGDDLLVKIAQRLAARLREEDTVGRLGGDEFVILLPEVGDEPESAGSHATRIADEIRSLFEKPFMIQGHDIHLTISIGIALFPGEVSAADLLKYADVAMYQAKNAGRNSVRLFSAEMQEAVNQQREIEKGLRQALVEQEFELYFQAQYDNEARVVGAETLLRWHHPELGLTAPGLFIEVAELTGLIVPIGDWVLRNACEHLDMLDEDIQLAVNVSPRQFSDPSFIDQLEQVLQDTGADPTRLKFEITEGLAMEDVEHTIETMTQLKQLGISFSVDDFGTGYSSLNYLNRLPVDELKIDQSFVRNISDLGENAVIVDTIIAMAQQLKLLVVAEGIESQAELDYLQAHDCDRYQGYYFARPVPFAEFIALIETPLERARK